MAPPNLYTGDQAVLWDYGHSIHLLQNELDLFRFWKLLPHPELKIEVTRDYLIGIFGGFPPQDMALVSAWVEERITPEQSKRFKFVAEVKDIRLSTVFFLLLKNHLKEIEGVLEAEKRDQLADFDAEDFRMMEREDERAVAERRARRT